MELYALKEKLRPTRTADILEFPSGRVLKHAQNKKRKASIARKNLILLCITGLAGIFFLAGLYWLVTTSLIVGTIVTSLSGFWLWAFFEANCAENWEDDADPDYE